MLIFFLPPPQASPGERHRSETFQQSEEEQGERDGGVLDFKSFIFSGGSHKLTATVQNAGRANPLHPRPNKQTSHSIHNFIVP